jgi:hypothetical protein
MATKSIFKDVKIKDRKLARRFVHALENSENVESRDVLMSKKSADASDDSIKALFKDF